MPIPIDISALDPWQVYVEDASWPAADSHRFIVDAAADMAWIKFKITPYDIAHDHEHCALRNEIAAALAELLMRGSVVATARPVGGGRLLPIGEAEWTTATATAAVSTGLIHRRHRSDRNHAHHVFIGAVEAAMMARVYAVTDLLVPREDQGTTEELAGIVLNNLSAIAGNKVALAPEDSPRRVLELLMPSLTPALDYNDEQKLVAAVAAWLVRRFEQDRKERTGLLRGDFCDEAVDLFKPFITKRLFEKVWAKATNTVVDERKPHEARTLRGRRTANPSARAAQA